MLYYSIIKYAKLLMKFTYFFFLDSEKFHEMAAATESPPKQCFLLDDDGEFPPMSKAK